MNLLFIHEVSFLKNVTFEWQQFPTMMAERGHNVYVIDYDSKWQKSSELVSHKQELKFKSGIKLIRPAFIKVPVLSRASAWVTHGGAIERAIKDYAIDVIILYSVPTNGIQTIKLAKKYGIPVVFRSIDTLNQLVHNKFLSKVTRMMEREVYSKVDLILTICPALSRYVCSMGADSNRVMVLPLGVDTQMFQPDIDTSSLEGEWFNNKDKFIVFVGTIPKFSGLDSFIRLFPQILHEVPESRLLIIGGGDHVYELDDIILKLRLGRDVFILGLQPYNIVPQWINLASVCINPFPICGATRDIFPTKVIQYMACGKPVVSTPLPGLVEMIRGDINGITYTQDWVKDIVHLLKSGTQRRILGQRGLDYVKRYHSYNKIIEQLETELGGLVKYG